MKTQPQRLALVAVLIISTVSLVWAIPGYHIDDDVSARKAVQQFAGDSFKFRAVVYQAELDHSASLLALEAHKYLREKPEDPQRECSFAEAYWSWQKAQRAFQQVETGVSVPQDRVTKLMALNDEAVKATKEAVQKMPGSVAAHLNYGNYLQYFGLTGTKSNIQLMLGQYKQAVSLRPDLGYTHYALALGYMGSGNDSAEAVDRIIKELTLATKLDPRLTESYYYMAAVNTWPTKSDFVASRRYLDKYLKLYPNETNSPRVVPLIKLLRSHNAAPSK